MIHVRCAKVHRSGGLTEAGKFSWYFFKADHIIYPANFPGLGEALIFFCFFSSIKGRKEEMNPASTQTHNHPRLLITTATERRITTSRI